MSDIIEKIKNGEYLELIGKILPVVLTIIVILIVIKILMKLVSAGIKRSKLEKGLHSFIEKTVKVILYFVAILIVADMMGIPVSSLLATFSIVGLAASLAIQDTLSNIASGITILATHPFKVDNFVDAGGTSGTVVGINFTHTILQTPDNRLIHIPNKQIVDATIINYSEMPKRRVDLIFNVSYNANCDKVKEVITNTVLKHDLVLKNEDIFVRQSAFQASGIDYTLRVWVNSKDYWTVYFDLIEEIKKALDDAGIEIPYNQLDVHVHN